MQKQMGVLGISILLFLFLFSCGQKEGGQSASRKLRVILQVPPAYEKENFWLGVKHKYLLWREKDVPMEQKTRLADTFQFSIAANKSGLVQFVGCGEQETNVYVRGQAEIKKDQEEVIILLERVL